MHVFTYVCYIYSMTTLFHCVYCTLRVLFYVKVTILIIEYGNHCHEEIGWNRVHVLIIYHT